MVCAALFSGGKESVYSIIEAEKLGINVEILIIMRTTLRLPSPHLINFEMIESSANLIGHEVKELELKAGKEIESLVNFLVDNKIDTLIAGDIYIEQHLNWYSKACSMAGTALIEPLWRRDTSSLLLEYLREGIRARIIGVKKDTIDVNLLGCEINYEIASKLIKNRGSVIDPCGENGEYHTLVTYSPLHSINMNVERDEIIVRDEMIIEKLKLKTFKY